MSRGAAWTALAFAAAFAVVTALNAAGAFAGVDGFAVRHLMPVLDPARSHEPTLGDVVRPFGDAAGAAAHAGYVLLYPASVPVSFALFALCGLVLWRQGRREAAVLWPAAWIGAVAVEVVVKHLVRRPALVAEGHHIVAFDDSLPSGHALRSVLVAGAVLYVWRRAGIVAAAWAIVVQPVLMLNGWHTPSDILAGAALGLATDAAVVALLRRE